MIFLKYIPNKEASLNVINKIAETLNNISNVSADVYKDENKTFINVFISTYIEPNKILELGAIIGIVETVSGLQEFDTKQEKEEHPELNVSEGQNFKPDKNK